MLKWQVSPSSLTSSQSRTDTSCASESDVTLTPEKPRRYKVNRNASKLFNRFSFDPNVLKSYKIYGKNRYSYESSDLTNITDLQAFSDLEQITDAEECLNDVFLRSPDQKMSSSIRTDSRLSNRSSVIDGQNIYDVIEKSFREIGEWIAFVLKTTHQSSSTIDWLKDESIIKQFSSKLSSQHRKRFKKIKKTLTQKKLYTDNILQFLKVCKKYHLKDVQLFHPSDWRYVITGDQNIRNQSTEWVSRARKVVTTFAWLAVTLKDNPKYDHCVGNCTLKYLREIISDIRPVIVSNSESLQSSPTPPNMLLRPMTSSMYDSDTSSFRKRKKVTFHDNVQQHHCRVENNSKPFFNSPPKDLPPPKYEEFVEMKKHSTYNSDQALDRTVETEQQPASTSPTALNQHSKSGTPQHKKQADKNNNTDEQGDWNTLPSKVKAEESNARELTTSFSRAYSRVQPNRIYSTSHNEDLSLYNPVSYISSSVGNRSIIKKSPQTQTKKNTDSLQVPQQPQLSKTGSFLKNSKKSPILSTGSQGMGTKQEPPHSPSSRKSPLLRRRGEDSKANTLTRAEIDDLNNLLCMFDVSEAINPNVAIDSSESSEISKQSNNRVTNSGNRTSNLNSRTTISDEKIASTLDNRESKYNNAPKLDTKTVKHSSKMGETQSNHTKHMPEHDNKDTNKVNNNKSSYMDVNKQQPLQADPKGNPIYETIKDMKPITVHVDPQQMPLPGTKMLEEEPRRQSIRGRNFIKLNDKSSDVVNEKNNTEKGQQNLSYLQDVVSELLAVGNVNTSESTNSQQTTTSDKSENNKRSPSKSRNITRSIGSIENFFDDIESQQIENQRLLNETTPSSESDNESDNQNCYAEGNDSGIDDTMPGLTKESSSNKRKSGKKHRSKHHNEEEHRSRHHEGESHHMKSKQKSEHTERSLRRSESESKKSRKHHGKSSKQDSERTRTNSLPRTSSKHAVKSDMTIRIDGMDYNSENIGRSGRSKERRSEPTKSSSKTSTDQKSHSKTRKSDPVVSTGKNRHENDIEGAAVGNNRRSLTDSHVHRVSRDGHSRSPDKTTKTRENDLLKPKDAEIKRNNSLHISSHSNEYMFDTEDGRHRVYVRQKEEDPGPLPKKKDLLREYDNNVRSMVKVKPSSELVDQLGVTPDIIQLLREEEKFWHRQQELKEWRKSRDKQQQQTSHRKDPPPYSYNNETKNQTEDDYHTIKRNSWHNVDAEVLREAEENRMAIQAQRMMKVRAEQEQILKTSRENLLDDFEHGNDKTSYHQNNHSHQPQHSPKGSSHGYQHPQNMYQNERNHNQAPYLSPPLSSNGTAATKSPLTSRSHSNSSSERLKQPTNNEISSSYIYTKVNASNGGCFSDDDEVFNERKFQQKQQRNYETENRGYFSDDGFRDNTVSKTYLARPMYRQQRNLLRCTACVKIISDQRLVYVDGHNFYWHSGCFKCVVCRALLNDSSPIRVRLVNYNLHCRFCFSARNGEQLSEV